ncbi:MAG: hypothetical protein HY317_05880 [Acidobacteria bacterium]|nr:hypothetical protein [Acidobacteriota bacterium]
MTPGIGATIGGLSALAALLLLPGLAVVRAPWAAVPFLSAAFWTLSWWWLPAEASRQRFVASALAGFALLAALRLAKPLGLRRPSWPALLVVAAAAARLACLAWPVAPGDEMGLQAASTLLLVWRDGVPGTGEPLLSVAPFGAHDPGLAALAADVALLSGLPAYSAALFAALAAHGLLQVAAFALLARVQEPRLVAPIATACLAPVAGGVLARGENATVLALAFAVAAAAALVRRSSRSSAVAAGAFLAAALESQPLLAAAVAPALLAACAFPGGTRPAGTPTALSRAALAAAVAAVTAAPFLGRLVRALGHGAPPELATVATARLAEAVPLGLCLVAAGALSGAMVRLGRRAGDLAVRVALVVLLVLGGAEGLRAHRVAGEAVAIRPAHFEGMAWIRDHTGPLDVVCSDARAASAWIPAVAQRAVRPEPLPSLPAGVRPARRPCVLRLTTPEAPREIGARVLFRNDAVTILQSP